MEFVCRYLLVACVCYGPSHPLFVEDELEAHVGVKRAAIRKLEHELGIPATQFDIHDLKYVSTVLYKVRICVHRTAAPFRETYSFVSSSSFYSFWYRPTGGVV